MNEMDQAQVIGYLNTAALFANAKNEYGEAYWLGRAIEYAQQNAVDHEWLTEQMEQRELDAGLVALPKLGEAEAQYN